MSSLLTKAEVTAAEAKVTKRRSSAFVGFRQHVEAVAFGSPSLARQIGRRTVDTRADDLRKLAKS